MEKHRPGLAVPAFQLKGAVCGKMITHVLGHLEFIAREVDELQFVLDRYMSYTILWRRACSERVPTYFPSHPLGPHLQDIRLEQHAASRGEPAGRGVHKAGLDDAALAVTALELGVRVLDRD